MRLNLTVTITLLYSVMASAVLAQTVPPLPPATEVLVQPNPYPTTLAAQIEALKTDPSILRYKKLREEQVKDSEFPTYHFRAPEGNIGDPDGFSYWQGRWHMFYQFRPQKPAWQAIAYWGHAVSPDLIHWEDLPIAIYPDKHKGAQVYSGGALVEKDRVLAIYHSLRAGNQVVESKDPLLLNWKKVPVEGVSIPNVEIDSMGYPYRVWDPSMYKEGGKYYSISGSFYGLRGKVCDTDPASCSGVNRIPVWHLFESDDLSKWNYIGELMKEPSFIKGRGDDGSCTYLWPLGDKHLLTSFTHRLGTQHFVGTLNTETNKFIPETHQFHHSGPSTSLPDPENEGSIIVVNVHSNIQKNSPRNFLTLPRRMSLGPNNTVLVEPVGDFASLRRNEKSFTSLPLVADTEKLMTGVNGRELEIMGQIIPGTFSIIDVDVFRSADGKTKTTVQFKRTATSVVGVETWVVHFPQFPDKDHPWSSPNPPEDPITFTRTQSEPIDFHFFLDRSVVEIYANKVAYLPKYIFDTENRTGVSITANGAGASITSFKAWQMVAEIYKPKPVVGVRQEFTSKDGINEDIVAVHNTTINPFIVPSIGGRIGDPLIS